MLLLLACVNLSGEWSGALECSSTDGDFDVVVEFTLYPENGDFTGAGVLAYSFHVEPPVEVEAQVDVEFEAPEAKLPQDLVYEVRGRVCTTTLGGYSVETDCSAYELSETEIHWDGANALSVDPDSGDCEGEITR